MRKTTNANRAARGFFTTSISNFRTLAERGASCAEIAAYLALAVSTDSSNEVSRAGNKSVATILRVSHKRAGLILDALVAKGAVTKRHLREVRDPTAARFDLPILNEMHPELIHNAMGRQDEIFEGLMVSNSSTAQAVHDLVIANDFVRSTMGRDSLARLIKMDARDALLLALELMVDCTGSGTPNLISRSLRPIEERRIGRTVVSRFSFGSATTDLPQQTAPHLARIATQIDVLADLGVIDWGLHAIFGGTLTQPTYLQPIGTLRLGEIAFDTPETSVALLSQLIFDAIGRQDQSNINVEETPKRRSSSEMIHVVTSVSAPLKGVIAIPRLRVLPDNAETSTWLSQYRDSCEAARDNLIGQIRQFFPSAEHDMQDILHRENR